MQGVTVHWEAAAPRADHAQCATQVEEIRRYHLNHGYSDIAYNWLGCVHGGRFQGRGWGVPSGANGTRWSNLNYFAVCMMTGPGEAHTDALHTVIGDLVNEGLGLCVAPKETVPHSRWVATACCGDTGRSWIPFPGSVTLPPPIFTLTEDDSMVTKYVNKQGNVAYFYIDDAGRFVQKSWAWPKAGWNTVVLDGNAAGVAKPGDKVTVEDNLKGDPNAGTLHLFARAKDGQNMAHASYVGRWVVQVD